MCDFIILVSVWMWAHKCPLEIQFVWVWLWKRSNQICYRKLVKTSFFYNLKYEQESEKEQQKVRSVKWFVCGAHLYIQSKFNTSVSIPMKRSGYVSTNVRCDSEIVANDSWPFVCSILWNTLLTSMPNEFDVGKYLTNGYIIKSVDCVSFRLFIHVRAQLHQYGKLKCFAVLHIWCRQRMAILRLVCSFKNEN